MTSWEDDVQRKFEESLLEEYERGYRQGFADAKSKQQWILCTPETMPDTDHELWSDHVLVTRKGHYPNGKEWRIVEKAIYCENLLSSDGRYRDTPGWAIGSNNYNTDCIVAWMPLPEVYKMGKEE